VSPWEVRPVPAATVTAPVGTLEYAWACVEDERGAWEWAAVALVVVAMGLVGFVL
jgi:hypothetical protein